MYCHPTLTTLLHQTNVKSSLRWHCKIISEKYWGGYIFVYVFKNVFVSLIWNTRLYSVVWGVYELTLGSRPPSHNPGPSSRIPYFVVEIIYLYRLGLKKNNRHLLPKPTFYKVRNGYLMFPFEHDSRHLKTQLDFIDCCIFRYFTDLCIQVTQKE